MKYLSVFACFIFLASCAANNTTSFLQHESTSTDTVAEHAETDNNIEKYKYQKILWKMKQKLQKHFHIKEC